LTLGGHGGVFSAWSRLVFCSNNGSRSMNQYEFLNHHEREAARLRALVANATTAALKSRLVEEAKKHDRLAKGLDDLDDGLVQAATVVHRLAVS
jgi:hypothetical protein